MRIVAPRIVAPRVLARAAIAPSEVAALLAMGVRGHVAVLVEGIGVGQVEAAEAVDLKKLHLDLVALMDDIGHLLDAVLGEPRDMAETFLAGEDLDKGAEVHDSLDDAVIDPPDLGILGDAENGVLGVIGRLLVLAVDRHGTVVIDVDLDAVGLAESLDILSARPDDRADLVDLGS